ALYDLIDFGPAFFTLAIKEGSSERLHLDFHDHPLFLSWVIAFGEWTGANFCCPQLGVNIPLPSGHILGAMTRRILHSGTPV
ncbi:hypothetical protein DFP72DRAFT_753558, partial [Ephemerocybe angulata]